MSTISIDDLVEIELLQDEDFLKVRETLTRIGVSSRKDNKLYQSCHILHKKGKYYIVHFKELFALDGLPTDITENDIARRNAIVGLLEEWDLLEIVDPECCEEPISPLNQIKIISYKEKDEWELVPKYHIGRK
ncbi:MAG: translational repressor RegA [Proteobacteria bacterium]|nr:translational repressor RegA [Pseudomonadota bacterium]